MKKLEILFFQDYNVEKGEIIMKKSVGRPKTDKKEVLKKLNEIENGAKNKTITQEFCARELGITHRTFSSIIKNSFEFSYLEAEQIPESVNDPYVSMMYIPAPGKLFAIGPWRGMTEHQKLLQQIEDLKNKHYKVYVFTESQVKKGISFTPRLSSEDMEIRDFAIRHGWGQKKARK